MTVPAALGARPPRRHVCCPFRLFHRDEADETARVVDAKRRAHRRCAPPAPPPPAERAECPSAEARRGGGWRAAASLAPASLVAGAAHDRGLRVYYRFDGARALRVVVVEPGGCWEDAAPTAAAPFAPALVAFAPRGANASRAVWSYRRAFIGHAAGSGGCEECAFYAATHAARPVGPRAYELELPLLDDGAASLAVLVAGGLDCSTPLERVRLAAPSPGACRASGGGADPACDDACPCRDTLLLDGAMRFVVTRGAADSVAPRANAAADAQHVRAWRYSNGTDPTWTATARARAPPPLRRAAVCLVGDSVFAGYVGKIEQAIAAAGDANSSGAVAVSYAKNWACDATLERTCGRGVVPLAAQIRKLPFAARCLSPTGVAVVSLGSHWFGAPLADAAAAARALAASAAAAAADRAYCLVVVATPDLAHENIPLKFGLGQKYLQNTWRLRAVNDAVREALADAPRAHFLDLFEPTVPLHFDGHHGHDPVHFSPGFSHAAARAIIETVAWHCDGAG